MAMAYMVQKGIEIQIWAESRPGMPSRMEVEGFVKLVQLESDMEEIKFSACLLQLYFILSFSTMESRILMAMAFDRYVDICDPLRHCTTLTNPMVAKIGLAMVLRGSMLLLPTPFLVRRWPYCRTIIIAHTHCEHISVVKLACADIHTSSYYSLSVAFLVICLDVFFIAVSYTQILRAILSLPTKDAWLKSFGTCGSHLCVILNSYIPALFSFPMHWFGHNVALHFHILMANRYLLLPTMLNPNIYWVRTQEIWDRLLQPFTHKGTSSFLLVLWLSDQAPCRAGW
ncbi:unnamed protein product [Caretta caretta]